MEVVFIEFFGWLFDIYHEVAVAGEANQRTER